MQYRTPLAKVRGLGSAKEGTHHFRAQRVTAVALVPLGLWFLASLIKLTGTGYEGAIAWMQSPLTTVLALALVATVFYHAFLGVQVVIEDYVHSEWQKVCGLLLLRFACALMALASVVAILKIALGR